MSAPTSPSPYELQKRNFSNVQIDAVGVGLAAAAAPFLPVLLTRLEATNAQVGLLTSMPGITGLLLAMAAGRFLQTRRNIVPWFGLSRLLVLSSYAFTGLVVLLVPQRELAVPSILGIWALASLPQTALAVSFIVVMNGVAGSDGRYALLSRRWSILGLTNFVTTLAATQMLDRIAFPQNYQILFLVLSLGGLVSFYFSNRILLPDQIAPPPASGRSAIETVREYRSLLRGHPAFASFVTKRFVYFSAIALGTPIFPLYFVRAAAATDAQIGTINMTMTLVMMFGYFVWSWVSRKRGGRFVLLATTAGLALYPALTSLTQRVDLIILYAGLGGLFQAGIDLVFFDELMKTVPPEYGATFVSMAQSLQYLSAIIAPLAGTYLADTVGLGGALAVSAGLRVAGFLLFLLPDRAAKSPGAAEPLQP